MCLWLRVISHALTVASEAKPTIDTLPQKDVLALHGCPQEHQLLRKAPLKPLLLDWALGIGEVGQEDVCILQPQHSVLQTLDAVDSVVSDARCT